MISTIIFSRDRACQLDLLLRSIQKFAPVLAPVTVLFRPTNTDYETAYGQVRFEHPFVHWRREIDFQTDMDATLRSEVSDLLMCMTDDSVFRGDFYDDKKVAGFMAKEKDSLCFSLRLGLNTTVCYPHQCAQQLPEFFCFDSSYFWEWRQGERDFGYPGSLDAHVFRREQFVEMLAGRTYRNPNEMEDALVAGCRKAPQSLMGCFEESLVCSVPVNRVNETHQNRYSGSDRFNEKALNDAYLRGERLLLEAVVGQPVDGAHAELGLVFS